VDFLLRSSSARPAAWIGPSHGRDGHRLDGLPSDRSSTGCPDNTAPPNTHQDTGGASSNRCATDTGRSPGTNSLRPTRSRAPAVAGPGTREARAAARPCESRTKPAHAPQARMRASMLKVTILEVLVSCEMGLQRPRQNMHGLEARLSDGRACSSERPLELVNAPGVTHSVRRYRRFLASLRFASRRVTPARIRAFSADEFTVSPS
jgi:hypothetical protein